MSFTPAQTDAKNATGRALLVSAAAGSGKTYTLTHRIIDKLLADDKATLSRMLIVTFTRSAAGELKAKISKALTEELEKHPDNSRLQKELINLGSAHISTIDSFFSAPVKANFEKLGLPAAMKLADDAELSPIRDEILGETLESFFNDRSGIKEGELNEVGHRNTYTDLLSLISGIRDSAALLPSLTSFYYKLLSSPNGVGQLKISAERLKISADMDFYDTEEGKLIKDHAVSLVDYAVIQLKKSLAEIGETAERLMATGDELSCQRGNALKTKVTLSFDGDLTKCTSLLAAISGDYREARNYASSFKFDRYVTLRGDDVSDESDHFKALRKKIVEPVKSLIDSIFSYSDEDIARHFTNCAAICETLADILYEFDRRYSAEKISRGICEFSDMPKFMLKLLQNDDGTPSPTAIAMSKDFDEVYIDEYQDVNAIQDRIFDLIGGSRRFMVGDIKQSIYGFRDAEPSIFAKYRKQFPKYNKNDLSIGINEGGSAIFMSENFRCDETVIDFANAVCSSIFNAFAESIGYDDENDRLRFAKSDKCSPDYKQPVKVKINLIQPAPVSDDNDDGEDAQISESTAKAALETKLTETEDKYTDEATIVANEIARLLRDKRELNADGSTIKPGDIAILVRGHGLIPSITGALSKLGIKYVSNAKNEILEDGDMKTLIDLLTVIDNPREDIPLCRVLTADIGYEPIMSLTEVITIRHACEKSRSLYDALISYAEGGNDEMLAEKCSNFAKMLKNFRLLSSRVSADKLLRAISRCETFSKLCESAAYTYLYVRACKYTKSSWNGLYAFLTYLKRLADKGESSSDPIKAKEDEVTVITMHQSKGLEYKVCFLYGLGKEFNMNDLNSPLIFTRELGLSVKLPIPHEEDLDVFGKAQRAREENLLWRSASILTKYQLLEEEARVFYVALTRAKERLYLSATLSKSYDEVLEEEYKNCYDLTREIKQSKSYIRWTLLTLSRLGKSTDFYDIETFNRGSIPPLATKISKAEIESGSYGITETDKCFAAILNDPHGESEEEKLLSMIPAKVAASKVSGEMLDESIFSTIPQGKLFSKDNDDPTTQSADTTEQIKNRIALMRSKKVDFDSLLEENKKPTAAEKGSAAHLILQYCDFENSAKNGIDADIDRLLTGRFITKRTAEIVDRRQLSGFFKSELMSMIRGAKVIHREFRFGMFRSAADFTKNGDLKELVRDKKIFVQGSIDLLIETEDGEIILCDYKTDKISREEKADRDLLVKNMRDRHKDQLEEYRFAVNEIFGKAPSRVFIYSIPLGEIIEI